MFIRLTISLATALFGAEAPDYTCFQVHAPYSERLDIASDVAVVYGLHDFAGRAMAWRDHGYDVSMMTGISWGNYGDYYMKDGTFKAEEVQTDARGKVFMHGQSETVGYNVPTASYVAFIKQHIDPAIEAGVRAIYLEEPEFWARTGWSAAFKREWERFYNESWQAPDSSPAAQYKASLLKYDLYTNALREVFAHIKSRDPNIECFVPTHSLHNYAHLRIVSPMTALMDLDTCDGYIAQVWTGTARMQNTYRGVTKERTFETALLEYGQMLSMVRPTGRKVWFLADPIEDNPNYSWSNYRLNYEATITASLLWPEVSRFEVMPWPNRIFNGAYPKVDLDQKSGDREGIPSEYATEILVIINALNEMDQKEIEWDCGTRGIGLLVSDTLMFQRANPTPSDANMGHLYGLAMPLLKHGIPVEPVQLETVLTPGALDRYKVLLLSYDGQKPMKESYHEALVRWVEKGNQLLYVGDGSDPYHEVPAWWNDNGATAAKAHESLLDQLKTVRNGEGASHWDINVRTIQHDEALANELRARVLADATKAGLAWKEQNYLSLRRGPYLVGAVFDESISEEALSLRGSYVDLFSSQLAMYSDRSIQPGERFLFYDLDWARAHGISNRVVVSGARVLEQGMDAGTFRFRAKGPAETTARAIILLESKPSSVSGVNPDKWRWDAEHGALWLEFPNAAAGVTISVGFQE